jgi:hypothetical protein
MESLFAKVPVVAACELMLDCDTTLLKVEPETVPRCARETKSHLPIAKRERLLSSVFNRRASTFSIR